MLSMDGFGSHGDSSAASGACGSHDDPSEGGTAPVLRAPRARARIENIIPCCVNQLITATLVDDVFKVKGVVVSQVAIVGVIRKAERAPNHILYKVDDMTAKPIDARHRLGRGKAKQEPTVCPVGAYAKVVGLLRGSAGARTLEVLQIRGLEDMNELTSHILETVNAHMTLAKAREAACGWLEPVAPSEADEAPECGEAPECVEAPECSEARPEFIQEEVLRLICECPRPEGESVRELQAELRTLHTEAIQEALDYLMFEGRIYPTVDGQHFKSAN